MLAPSSAVEIVATVAAWNVPGDPPPVQRSPLAPPILGSPFRWFRFVTGSRDRADIAGKAD